MINRKAQIFGIWLVVLTITMCLVVVGFYYFQQNQIRNSIILPNDFISLQNDKQMFEIQEKQILAQSLRDALASSSETADDFVFIFRDKFFASILKPEQGSFRNFLFNSKLDNQDISKQALSEPGVQVYYLEQVYSFEQNYLPNSQDYEIKVKRKPISKFLLLKPSEKNKIAFNIRIDYSFAKEYTIISGAKDSQEVIAGSQSKIAVEGQTKTFIIRG